MKHLVYAGDGHPDNDDAYTSFDTDSLVKWLDEQIRSEQPGDFLRIEIHTREDMSYSSVYDALAEHILEGRLEEEEVDHSALRDFLAQTDDGGGDRDWEAIDDALDRLTARFKEARS